MLMLGLDHLSRRLFLGHDLRNAFLLIVLLHLLKVDVLDHASKILNLRYFPEVFGLILVDAILGPECETGVNWVGLGGTREGTSYLVLDLLVFLLLLDG